MNRPFLQLRSAFFIVAGLSVIPLAGHAQPASAVTLKDAYRGIFHMGVAIRPDQVNGQNPRSAALILQEFDCISPENVMKMGPIHPRPGNDDSSYEFGPADQYVDFGVKNKLFVIGHTLCWHSQMPGWMSQPEPGQEKLTEEVLMQRLKDHIFKVVGRYKGRVNGWDVVNEALADNPSQQGDRPYGLRSGSPFNRTIGGPEYILMAFKWAHEADPAAELYYNDYNLDASDFKRANCIELIKYLKARGAAITGVGMQGHYNLNSPTAAKIDETIKMFSDLGIKVMTTELDVRALASNQLTGAVPTGAAAGGRGRGGRGGLPPVDTLKTSLTLADDQVAKITPILEKLNADIAAAAGDFPKIGAARTAAVAALRPILTPAQQKSFDEQFMPSAGGGAPVGARPAALTAEQQEALAKRYGEIFAVFLKHRAAMTRVTFWGLRDADSWRRQDSPLVFDENYQPKPAHAAVLRAVTSAGEAPTR